MHESRKLGLSFHAVAGTTDPVTNVDDSDSDGLDPVIPPPVRQSKPVAKAAGHLHGNQRPANNREENHVQGRAAHSLSSSESEEEAAQPQRVLSNRLLDCPEITIFINIYTPSVFCYDERKKNFDIHFSMKKHT